MSEKKTFEEYLDDLKHTRDFELYLDIMNELKDRYLIILCTKEVSGPNVSETAVEKIRSLGFLSFPDNFRFMYLGAADRGNVLCDGVSEIANQPVRLEGTAGKAELYAASEHYKAEITIDGTNWSLDERGLNFAVYDPKKSEIVDVTCYDAFANKPTFYHRNFFYSDQYIADHIYMPVKYMDRVTRPMKKSYFSNRKLGVREVENGIVLPGKKINGKTYGGVCDESFNFIAGHQIFDPEHGGGKRHFRDSYTVPPEEIEYLDETVVYGGAMYNHPGHLVCECFADRIWWFIKNADSNLKVAVTVLWEYTVKVWGDNIRSSEYAFFVKDFLKTFGIPEDRIVFVKNPMKFKKVIIPDQSYIPLDYTLQYEFTSEYLQVFQHMRDPNITAKYKKIYLTKLKSPRQTFINEEFFIDFYKKRGFEIICFEDYNVKEQVELLYSADEVVALEGTLAHMAVFCKPTAKFTILSKMFSYLCPMQPQINEASGAEIYHVNISGSFFSDFSERKACQDQVALFSQSLSLLCVTEEFRKYVKYYFNEDLDITPEESLKSHLYEYIARAPEHFFTTSYGFSTIKELKMSDILQNISEVFFRKNIDTSHIKLSTSSDLKSSRDLIIQKRENELNLEKVKVLTSRANALIDENKDLKLYIARLRDEIDQLRSGGDSKTGAEIYPQKHETEDELEEAYRRMDELEKRLIQAEEEKSALAAYLTETGKV